MKNLLEKDQIYTNEPITIEPIKTIKLKIHSAKLNYFTKLFIIQSIRNIQIINYHNIKNECVNNLFLGCSV